MHSYRLLAASFICVFLVALSQLGCAPMGNGLADDPAYTGPVEFSFESPGLVPLPFAPELVRTDDAEIAVAISPRNDELLFTRVSIDEGGIHFVLHASSLIDGDWTEPRPFIFSSDRGETEAFFDVSGDRLYFYSGRPEPGAESPPRAMNLWYVEREGEDWGEPVLMGRPDAPIEYGWSGSLLGDDTFFFTARPYEDLGLADIYRVSVGDDGFGVAESIGPPVNTPEYTENEPAVAPDGSYFVFYSAGRPDNLSTEMLGDLYISFRQSDGSWGEPRHIAEPINSVSEENWPRISHDGEYLFFSSNRRDGAELPDLYWVSTDVLERYRPANM